MEMVEAPSWWEAGGTLEVEHCWRQQELTGCRIVHAHTCTHAHTRIAHVDNFLQHTNKHKHTHIFIKIISKALSLKLFETEIYFHFCIVTAKHRIPQSVEDPPKKMEALAGLVIQSLSLSLSLLYCHCKPPQSVEDPRK